MLTLIRSKYIFIFIIIFYIEKEWYLNKLAHY